MHSSRPLWVCPSHCPLGLLRTTKDSYSFPTMELLLLPCPNLDPLWGIWSHLPVGIYPSQESVMLTCSLGSPSGQTPKAR